METSSLRPEGWNKPEDGDGYVAICSKIIGEI
jgi:hypothetical protein